MPTLHTEIRRSAYYDSVTLMQLQKALSALPHVLDAGVMMGTPANQELLQQSGLLDDAAKAARPEDLLIAVRAEDEAATLAALAQVDALLARRTTAIADEYRPRSIESALKLLPNAQWALVSLPGRFAAGVAHDALRAGRHVFLYSDNVPLSDEITLKQQAQSQGLLVMGPDCGTALIGGVGLGFANRVRRGHIGIIGASGTGTQAVAARVHQLGAGISHAIGTGSRDLQDTVGALTTLQALRALAADAQTRVIALISKPPSPQVAAHVLRAAKLTGKPVVVDFIGYSPSHTSDHNLHFARTLSETAALAVTLCNDPSSISSFQHPVISDQPLALGDQSPITHPQSPVTHHQLPMTGKYLRGLYSGGTLAYEAMLLLHDDIGEVYSNAPLNSNYQLLPSQASKEHTIIDLGAEEFMLGRLHPMIDNDLRIRRLRQEAADPATAVILLDVVLGYGANADPASELAPVIAEIRRQHATTQRLAEIVIALIGTDADPQNLESQIARLRDVGAHIETDHAAAVRHAAALVRMTTRNALKPIDLNQPFAAINVGLEMFAASLKAQDAAVIHVDWQPPASGNEKLMAILARLKK